LSPPASGPSCLERMAGILSRTRSGRRLCIRGRGTSFVDVAEDGRVEEFVSEDGRIVVRRADRQQFSPNEDRPVAGPSPRRPCRTSAARPNARTVLHAGGPDRGGRSMTSMWTV
jgi:hypothetical protein